MKAELSVARAPPAAQAAKNATTTIPIVMFGVADAVGSGFVANLARPGGNMTGVTNIMPELGGKRLELLREVIPKLSRVALSGLRTGSGAQALCQGSATGSRRIGNEISAVGNNR